MILESSVTHEIGFKNIGEFIFTFGRENPHLPVVFDKIENRYQPVLWSDFLNDISLIMQFFANQKAQKNSHVVFYSPNCLPMLQIELAIMSLGLVSVPLFYGYKETRINELLDFTEGTFIVVYDEDQLKRIDVKHNFQKILHIKPITDSDLLSTYGDKLASYSSIINGKLSPDFHPHEHYDLINRHDRALMMYTSGTMSFPKGVQLSHGNILSQQEALDAIWTIPKGGKVLSFLPWHHSFGGIFEKYFALYSGTAIILDDSRGKDIDLLLSNWEQTSPNYFFSVPKIFFEVVTRTFSDPRLEKIVFHKELKFVFTAGAPLAANISEVFAQKNIPIFEGWGLTETSPSCTVTDGVSERIPGIVGGPIPGVKIKLDEDNEILIQGPNVMSGYFKNPTANAKAFTEDGWFRTGDLGEFVEGKVKILSRKDRIFKLSNAEKINPTAVEGELLGRCKLLKHVLVFGSGMSSVSALVFPDSDSLKNKSRKETPACENPRDISNLSMCLRSCIADLNSKLKQKYESIETFILIDQDLDLEKGELTPSMKVNPGNVYKNFRRFLWQCQRQLNSDPLFR